jgi:tetratricopeptide (TPR) repeat protein
MKAGGLAILPILTFLLAGTAATQDQDRQWNSCGLYDEHGKLQAGASPDLVIGACTVIIEAGQETTKDLAGAFVNRGAAYRDKREYDRAIQDFDQAIGLDPNNTRAFYSRGIAHNSKREYDRAIQDFDQAIRLDPNNAPAFNDRGTAYNFKRDYDRAIQDYDQAIRLDPNYARAFYNRGIAYYDKRRGCPAC